MIGKKELMILKKRLSKNLKKTTRFNWTPQLEEDITHYYKVSNEYTVKSIERLGLDMIFLQNLDIAPNKKDLLKIMTSIELFRTKVRDFLVTHKKFSVGSVEVKIDKKYKNNSMLVLHSQKKSRGKSRNLFIESLNAEYHLNQNFLNNVEQSFSDCMEADILVNFFGYFLVHKQQNKYLIYTSPEGMIRLNGNK